MTTERTCPHCGGAVAEDRNICPHCFRTLPVAHADKRPETPGPPPAAPTPEAIPPTAEPSPYQPPPAADQPPADQRPPAETPPPYQPPPAETPPADQPPPPYRPPADQPPPYQPPAAYQPPPEPPPPRQDDTLAIVGLIMGVLGIACCGCLSMLCPIGLIMSIIAHNRRPTGLSLAGIIIGAIGSVVFLVSVGWSIYVTMHPEVYEEMMRRLFEQMDIPMPPGFPRP